MLSLHSRSFLRMIRKDWEIYALKFITLSIAFATAILILGFVVREFSIGNNFSNDAVRILQRNETKQFEGRNRLSNRIPEEVYKDLPFTMKDHDVFLPSADIKLNYSSDSTHSYILQPAREIYFGPRVVGENIRHGDWYCILILTCISALIIILATTNFVNLVSLTLPARSKELAMRKVAGANRPPLLGLMMKENAFVVIVSVIIALTILVSFAEPAKEYFYIEPVSIVILIALFVAIAIAPLIPAWTFIKASPGRLLSTDTITFPRMKKVITIIQLGISMSLIIVSLVIDRQISRSLIKEPGKNHDQVVYTKWPQGMSRQYLERLKNDWPRDNPSIVELTAVSHTPDNINSRPIGESYYQVGVDYNFKDFMRLDLSQGRWFGAMDDDSVVVNEAGVGTTLKPLGVVKDFSPDKPVHFSINDKESNFIMIRVLEVDIRTTLRIIARSFTELSGRPTNISFLDRNYAETLAYEDRLNKLSSLLALVSLIMASCSIYALSLSRMNDNVKQIAIRKTFGASDGQIVGRLSLGFLEMMLGAIFFFGPVTYLLLQEWLRNFAYTARFNWFDPLISIGTCFVILIITNFSMLIKLRKPLAAIHRDLRRT